MLKKKDIKNGKIVYSTKEKEYYVIENVGNAISKKDRDSTNLDDDELSYSIYDLLDNYELHGICENSHTTQEILCPAEENDIYLYFSLLEAKAIIKIGEADEEYFNLLIAKENFYKKLKNNEIR